MENITKAMELCAFTDLVMENITLERWCYVLLRGFGIGALKRWSYVPLRVFGIDAL